MLWLASRWRSNEPKVRRASSGSRPQAIASSMCDCNSSSISRFRRSLCTAFEIRDQKDMSCLSETPIDGEANGLPARLLRPELLFAGGGQLIYPGAATGVFLDPLGANPARFL